ncbi:hypothetical protein J919_3260 [Acinetobacter baumannii 25493_6]|nr:hypothetical protein J666_3842 [Acinetobacter baumannii 1237202]EYD27349.1 hypothetical protein J922_3126 [Acinetobacter baumannii 25493_9]EYD42072.1 hypothetical protein J919_3260 [Acinetobacter baumannii 25493_6]
MLLSQKNKLIWYPAPLKKLGREQLLKLLKAISSVNSI